MLHRTIADVTADMAAMRVNTAIAKLIVLNNHLTTLPTTPRAAVEALVLMTAPVAPHVAEELWSRLGHDASLAYAPFPVADPAYLVEDTVTCILQVQGKVRGRVEVAGRTSSEDDLRELALADAGVQRALDGRGDPHGRRPGAQARQRGAGLSRARASPRRRSRSSPTRPRRCPKAPPSGGGSASSRSTSSSTASRTSRASTCRRPSCWAR